MALPSRFPDSSIAVLGCGYVGLTLAAVLADVGFDVLGVEIREDVLADLKRGVPHFREPGLPDMLARLTRLGRLRFARHLPEAGAAQVYIITVGTPLDDQGRARLDMVESVAREVASALRAGDLVIMRSTVKLGTTRTVVTPLLDASGVAYDLAFCPERTLEGQALSELRHLPQIVGAATPEAAMRASQLFQILTPTTVRVSSLEAAEMIKLVDNAQRDVAFGFANEVARLCDHVGVSAIEVIRAGKLGYPRTNLPIPGPVGGPCLTKDPYILAESFEAFGVRPEIALAARRVNEVQPEEAARRIGRRARATAGFPPHPTVSVLGLAFKGRPETDDLRGTMARPIIDCLRREFPGAQFRGWDAVVGPAAIATLGVTAAASLEDALAGAHLVVIANNHAAFERLALADCAERLGRPALVYDFWNNFDGRALELPDGVTYLALGSAGIFR